VARIAGENAEKENVAQKCGVEKTEKENVARNCWCVKCGKGECSMKSQGVENAEK